MNDICGRHSGGVAVRAVDGGLIEALAGEAGHAHHLSDTDKIGTAGIDEDAVRCGRIAVAGQVLDVEAGSGGSAFKVADHDAFGRDVPSNRRRKPAALDGIDRGVVGTNIICREANDKVEYHIVGGIISILIADLIRQHGQGTGFTVNQRDARVERKGGRSTAETGCNRSTGGTS